MHHKHKSAGQMVDVLQFLALPDESAKANRSRQTHGLGTSVDIVTPIDASGYGQWKHIKNVRGWPWDLKLYDENYVYDWVTEGPHGWSEDANVGPRSFKKFIKNHIGPAREPADGLITFPRYVNSVNAQFEMAFRPAQTHYATFENCVLVCEQSLGPVRQLLHGPFMMYHGGDVGMQPTLIHQYCWLNDGKPTIEENHYALHWGWVAWKLMELNQKTGFYELLNETVAVQLRRVERVAVEFPCF